ncbi:MAG: response regulator [Myxococcota bacterium]|jgi:CheY-like chemotaxis protein|nr:response regulator [Myxococcota bacterium]
MPVEQPTPSSACECVLIVEDDDDSRDMLSELVSMLGHRAVGAANSVEALLHLKQAQPTIALIDIGLPDVDGCEVAQLLRADPAGRGVHLVALTGYSDLRTRETARAAGFDDFLVKPILPDTLQAVLARGS